MIDVAILSLAAYRVTRLVTTDVLFQRPRAWVLDWFARHRAGWLETLLSCSFCTGVWVSAGLYWLWIGAFDGSLERRWQVHAVVVAAIAGGQSMLFAIEDRLEADG